MIGGGWRSRRNLEEDIAKLTVAVRCGTYLVKSISQGDNFRVLLFHTMFQCRSIQVAYYDTLGISVQG